jgi:hypothetical protein
MHRFISRRRSLYLVLAAALIALGLVVSTAYAHSGPNYAKAQIQKDNSTAPLTDCGPLGTSKKIGSATFTSKKGILTVIGKIRGGPSGSYDLDLYRIPTGGGCELVDTIDSFNVDGSGDGNFAGSIPTCGSDFFVDAHDLVADIHNLSTVVHLGSLGNCVAEG